MKKWQEGDRVRIIAREQTPKDTKELTYYPHYAGLEGTVSKVYSPDEVCVVVDRESLPEANAARQVEIEQHLRDRWLDGLSQDARSKLSEAEQKFHLNYTILISSADLEPAKAGKARDSKAQESRLRPKDLDKAEEEFLKRRNG